MNFAQFCAANGLLIRIMRPTGKVQRCGTVCAPSERKGWYCYDGGNSGYCGIWHGLDNGAQRWQPGADAKPLTPADFARIAAKLAAAEAERARAQYAASIRAQGMLKRSEMRSHAYLARKGFPAMLAPTMSDGETLLVTMRDGKRLANLQTIAGKAPETDAEKARQKLFLPGGMISGTRHQIGDVGTPVNCEGYATALSVAAAITACRLRAHTVCWFTAGNMAAHARVGVVIADNDALKTSTGEKAAKQTGLPYWMPPEPGQDFNDYHREKGLFAASQVMRGLLLIR